MYSKRVLYKPTTRENAVMKEKRKSLVQGRLVSESSGVALDPGPLPREPKSLFEIPSSDRQIRKALTSSPVTSCDDSLHDQNELNKHRLADCGDLESKKTDPASFCLSDNSGHRHQDATGSAPSVKPPSSAAQTKGRQRFPKQATSNSRYSLKTPSPDEIMGNLRPKRTQNRTSPNTGSTSRHRMPVPDPDGLDLKCSSSCNTRKASCRGEKSARKVKSSGQRHKCPSAVADQTDVDLIYARYLQAVYLESCALRAYKQQEKHLMTELYQMAELVTEKQKQKEELEEQVTRLRHDNQVDDALHTQETGLLPVVLGLERLRKQYSTLSSALDTTQQLLPIRGVHIPHDMDQFIGQLHTTLTESEQLLGELSAICRDKQQNVQICSDRLHTLVQTTDQQAQQLSGCQQSLDAASILTIQESSLRIQDLQLASS